MTKYIKTGTTEFEQFDETEWNRIYQDFDDPDKWEAKASELGIDRYHGYFVIPTKDGDMRIHDGDWIATGVDGEHWPVKDEIFKKTYKKLPKLTRPVSRYLEYCKEHWNLNDAFLNAEYLVSDKDAPEVFKYLSSHPDDFARAWLDGYEVAEVDE